MRWLLPLIAAVVVAFAPFVAIATSDSNSPLLGLLLMGDGLHNNDWGQQTNANLTKIENAISGVTVLNVTSGQTTLTLSQSNYAVFSVGGTLSGDVSLVLGTDNKLFYLIDSTTHNGHNLKIYCKSIPNVYTFTTNGARMFACIGGYINSTN